MMLTVEYFQFSAKVQLQQRNAATPQPKEQSDITTKRTKSTKEEHIYFKIRCHLRYPIFVSFANFVVLTSCVDGVSRIFMPYGRAENICVT